jgi:ribosomal protein S18 acetylase RimI-like enzyme
MIDAITIRTITPKLVGGKLNEAVSSLLCQLSDKPKQYTFDELKNLVSNPDFALIAAIDHEKKVICGMASVYFIKTLMKNAALIEDVVVDEKYRGKKIGERLVKKLIETAKDRNVEFIDLTSAPEKEPANKLYQKLGFKKRNTNCYRLKL